MAKPMLLIVTLAWATERDTPARKAVSPARAPLERSRPSTGMRTDTEVMWNFSNQTVTMAPPGSARVDFPIQFIARLNNVDTNNDGVPIINGGDGWGEHPTQVLTDLYTVYKEKGTLDGLNFMCVGDMRMRTMHSIGYAMSQFDIKGTFVSPPDMSMTDEFKAYAQAIVDNSRVLADTLVSRGFDLVTGGSDNHLILIDLTSKDVPGKVAAQALDRAGMVANYNSVPFDTRKPFDPSGVRIGTPAITSRGMGADEMKRLGNWMADVVEDVESEALAMSLRDIAKQVIQLMPEAMDLFNASTSNRPDVRYGCVASASAFPSQIRLGQR